MLVLLLLNLPGLLALPWGAPYSSRGVPLSLDLHGLLADGRPAQPYLIIANQFEYRIAVAASAQILEELSRTDSPTQLLNCYQFNVPFRL